MNKVILKGRLAKEIELKTTQSGKNVAQTTIAVDRRSKEQPADFLPLVIWNQQAEIFAKYLAKGREVLVEGRIQTRSYEDKNGIKRYVTEVMVDSFEFCGSKKDAEGNSASSGQGAGFGSVADADVEDIPF